MLERTRDFEDSLLPIVSLCIITDRNRCPPNFTPILKCHDDGSEADLWKDGFGFGIFGRCVRYIAVNRTVPQNGSHDVITDLAIISEKEAVPTNFVCIDYTVDTKERALKKKFICARFTQRNDAIDALTDIIVLNKSKRPPKDYVSAGDVDGVLICFKVSQISPHYGIKQSIPNPIADSLYPSLSGTTSVNMPQGTSATFGAHCGLDGVPFQLNPRFSSISSNSSQNVTTNDANLNVNLESYSYNFRVERSIIGKNN